MAVPKKRRSKSSKRRHRSAWKISIPTLVTCTNCGEFHVPHRACTNCGYYKNSPVIQIKSNQSSTER